MLEVYYLRLKNWLESEEGQDLIEYALLVVFIAIIVLVVLPYVGTAVSSVFDKIRGTLSGATTS